MDIRDWGLESAQADSVVPDGIWSVTETDLAGLLAWWETRGERMEEIIEVREAWWRNPAYALAGLAWANWFVLCWAMALELVAGSTFVIGLWVGFLLLAVMGSAMGGAKRKKEDQ